MPQPVSYAEILSVGGILPVGKCVLGKIGQHLVPADGEHRADETIPLCRDAAEPLESGSPQKMQEYRFRLIICGVGDSEKEIIDAAKFDDRIVFLGQLPREEVLRIQTEATVLVNPRKNHEEFTKYSFPSKILEYLSAGKPVVAYKLDGIPDEYDAYLHYPSDESAEALSKKIIVCEYCGRILVSPEFENEQ
jgi:glycosyltransferase involved in cell wall biosynthesis